MGGSAKAHAPAAERACNLPRAAIEKFAETAAQTFQCKPGADMWDLVTRLGGRIRIDDSIWIGGATNSITVDGEGDFEIVLSSISGPRRDRFTIAHELGHYFLHAEGGKVPLIATRAGSDRAEWEANWFAAAFLMPGNEFRAAWMRAPSGRKVSEVASAFAVSEAAAKVRAKVLGIDRDER